MDGHSIDPRVAVRMRHLDLEELSRNNKTKCDQCANVEDKASALELWRGNVCIYVVCLPCAATNGFSVTSYPDGIHVTQGDGGSEIVRGAESLLPSRQRPSQFRR